MQIANLIFHNLISFIAIISIIVFIHEFGHFIIARLCGVKVEIFSIGFGREIFGFNDKKGTRWRMSALPFGGYVKMLGDQNAASQPDFTTLEKMSEDEKKHSFAFKNPYQKFAIVIFGPLINIIFAILLLTALFKINGISKALPIIDSVIPNSPASEVHLQKNDEILKIEDREILDFNDIAQIISKSPDKELSFLIKRKEEIIKVKITPKIQENKNIFGEAIKTPMIGISSSKIEKKNLNLIESFQFANKETYSISIAILDAINQLILGKKSIKELNGPVKIAQYSGASVDMGILTIIWFMAMISLNLGIMNLLPIPMLDGGHLCFYIIEIILRKPVPIKIQQILFLIGASLLFALMSFTLINDIVNLNQ